MMLSSLFVMRQVPSAVSSMLLKNAFGAEGDEAVVAMQLDCAMSSAIQRGILRRTR